MSYNNNYSRDREESHPGIFRGVFDLLLVVITMLCSITLLLTLLSPYIEPSSWWIFPILALVAPAIYILNAVITLYWIIRWRWIVALPTLILLLIGASKVSLFVKMESGKDYGLESYKGMIKVMSYNVKLFINTDDDWATDDIMQYIETQSPNVICLQEYNTSAAKLKEHINTTLKGYNRVIDNGLALFSRYPIIQSEVIFNADDDDLMHGMWVDILVGKDSIRVFNNHLYSTSIKMQDDEYLTSSQIVNDTLRRERLHDIVTRFHGGAIERAKQVNRISTLIAESPYPTIVCGDFNDTPLSYTYRVMSRGLQDAFRECGKGYSHTYRGFYNTLRIDYILVSSALKPRSYLSDEECLISDHLPITAHIEILERK